MLGTDQLVVCEVAEAFLMTSDFAEEGTKREGAGTRSTAVSGSSGTLGAELWRKAEQQDALRERSDRTTASLGGGKRRQTRRMAAYAGETCDRAGGKNHVIASYAGFTGQGAAVEHSAGSDAGGGPRRCEQDSLRDAM